MSVSELEKAYKDADAAFEVADKALRKVRVDDPTLEKLESVQVHEQWKVARQAVVVALGALRDAEPVVEAVVEVAAEVE